MSDHSQKRHLAKTITWRIVGTLDTIILSWLISGNPFIGLKVGLAEVLTKMALYYMHERVWFKVNLTKDGVILESRKRHLAKTFTWRTIGTLDTMLLAWLISGDPMMGFQIGLFEVITKMILYYLHERAWYKVNFGLEKRSSR